MKRIRNKPTETDHGTPELRAKRMRLIGPQRPNWPAPDPAAAESALGVLLWQGYLHPDYDAAKRMHDAGIAFAGWWRLVHPKDSPQGPLGRLQEGSGVAVVDTLAAENSLRLARAVLARERQVLDAVINCAVYQRVNLRVLDKLRLGLGWLATWLATCDGGRRKPLDRVADSAQP